MTQVKQGDTVKVHYLGRFDDGKVFYDAGDGDPLQFTISEDLTFDLQWIEIT